MQKYQPKTRHSKIPLPVKAMKGTTVATSKLKCIESNSMDGIALKDNESYTDTLIIEGIKDVPTDNPTSQDHTNEDTFMELPSQSTRLNYHYSKQSLVPINTVPIEDSAIGQQLSDKEKAHALISFAQKLVMDDFMAWQSETGNDIEEETNLVANNVITSPQTVQFELPNEAEILNSTNTESSTVLIHTTASQTHINNYTVSSRTCSSSIMTRHRRTMLPNTMVDTGVQTDWTSSAEGSLVSTDPNTPLPSILERLQHRAANSSVQDQVQVLDYEDNDQQQVVNKTTPRNRSYNKTIRVRI